jgi:hypothetical protein
MAFGAFNVLERYALIDLGMRIDLPWQQIADMTKATAKAIDEKGNCEKHRGPHVAIGEISYPADRKGILIYIKSSLTGDENDYVFHYKKRYSAFPHETTLDQLSRKNNSRLTARSAFTPPMVSSTGAINSPIAIRRKTLASKTTSTSSMTCFR